MRNSSASAGAAPSGAPPPERDGSRPAAAPGSAPAAGPAPLVRAAEVPPMVAGWLQKRRNKLITHQSLAQRAIALVRLERQVQTERRSQRAGGAGDRDAPQIGPPRLGLGRAGTSNLVHQLSGGLSDEDVLLRDINRNSANVVGPPRPSASGSSGVVPRDEDGRGMSRATRGWKLLRGTVPVAFHRYGSSGASASLGGRDGRQGFDPALRRPLLAMKRTGTSTALEDGVLRSEDLYYDHLPEGGREGLDPHDALDEVDGTTGAASPPGLQEQHRTHSKPSSRTSSNIFLDAMEIENEWYFSASSWSSWTVYIMEESFYYSMLGIFLVLCHVVALYLFFYENSRHGAFGSKTSCVDLASAPEGGDGTRSAVDITESFAIFEDEFALTPALQQQLLFEEQEAAGTGATVAHPCPPEKPFLILPAYEYSVFDYTVYSGLNHISIVDCMYMAVSLMTNTGLQVFVWDSGFSLLTQIIAIFTMILGSAPFFASIPPSLRRYNFRKQHKIWLRDHLEELDTLLRSRSWSGSSGEEEDAGPPGAQGEEDAADGAADVGELAAAADGAAAARVSDGSEDAGSEHFVVGGLAGDADLLRPSASEAEPPASEAGAAAAAAAESSTLATTLSGAAVSLGWNELPSRGELGQSIATAFADTSEALPTTSEVEQSLAAAFGAGTRASDAFGGLAAAVEAAGSSWWTGSGTKILEGEASKQAKSEGDGEAAAPAEQEEVELSLVSATPGVVSSDQTNPATEEPAAEEPAAEQQAPDAGGLFNSGFSVAAVDDVVEEQEAVRPVGEGREHRNEALGGVHERHGHHAHRHPQHRHHKHKHKQKHQHEPEQDEQGHQHEPEQDEQGHQHEPDEDEQEHKHELSAADREDHEDSLPAAEANPPGPVSVMISGSAGSGAAMSSAETPNLPGGGVGGASAEQFDGLTAVGALRLTNLDAVRPPAISTPPRLHESPRAHMDSPRGAHMDSPRAHMDSPRGAHMDSPRAHMDSPRGAHGDSPRAHMNSPRGAHKNSPRELQQEQESLREKQRSEASGLSPRAGDHLDFSPHHDSPRAPHSGPPSSAEENASSTNSMDHAPAHASEEEQKNQNHRFIEGEHKMEDHGAQEWLPRDLDVVDRSKYYGTQTRKNSSILSRSGTGLGPRQLFYYGEEETKVPSSSTSAHDHDSANKPRTTQEQFLSRLADLYSLQTNQKLNRECQRLLEYRALGKINRVIFWDWIVLVGAIWMMLYFYVEWSCVGSTPFADLPGNLEGQASNKELGGDVQSGLHSSVTVTSAASASSDSSTVVTPTSNSNMIQGFFPPSESASRHKIADGLAGKNTLWQTLYVAWSGYTNCGLHLWGTAMYVWNEDILVLLVLSLLVLVGNSMFPMVLRYSLTLGRWWNSRKRGYNFYDSNGMRSASGVFSGRESEDPDPLAALDAEIEKMILARTRTTNIDTIFQNDQRAEQHRERVSDSVSKAVLNENVTKLLDEVIPRPSHNSPPRSRSNSFARFRQSYRAVFKGSSSEEELLPHQEPVPELLGNDKVGNANEIREEGFFRAAAGAMTTPADMIDAEAPVPIEDHGTNYTVAEAPPRPGVFPEEEFGRAARPQPQTLSFHQRLEALERELGLLDESSGEPTTSTGSQHDENDNDEKKSAAVAGPNGATIELTAHASLAEKAWLRINASAPAPEREVNLFYKEPGAPPDTTVTSTTEKKPKIRMFGKRPTTPGPELANKDDAKMILIDTSAPTSSLTVQQRVQRLIAAVRTKISDPQQQAGLLLALAFFAHCGLDAANTSYATTKVDSVNARKLVDLIATRNKVLVAMRKAKEDLEMKKFIATAVSFRRSGAVEDEERAPDHQDKEQNQDPFQAPGSEREGDNVLHVDLHSSDFAAYEFVLKHPRRCCTHLFPQIHTKWLLLFSVTLNLVMFLCMAWQDWDGEVWAYLYDLHNKEVDNRSDVDGSNYADPAEAAAVFASTAEAYFVALLKLTNMLLQSHSTRTTGWSCLNVDGFSLPTLFLFLICMYISTSPTVVAMRYSALLPSSRSLGALSGEVDGELEGREHEFEGVESGSTPPEAIEMVEQVVDERLPSEEREGPIDVEQVGGDDVEKKGDAAKVVLVLKKDDESAAGKDALSVASQGSKPDSLAAEMADVDAALALAEAEKTPPPPSPPQRVSLFGGLVQSFASSLGYYNSPEGGAGAAEPARTKPLEAATELRNGSKRSSTSTPSNKATRAAKAAKIPSKSASEETLECVDITGQTAAEDAGAAGEAVLGEGGDDGGSGAGKTTLRGQIRNYMLQHSVFLVVAVFFVLCSEKAELARRDAEAEQVVVEIGSGPSRGSASALVETDTLSSLRRAGVGVWAQRSDITAAPSRGHHEVLLLAEHDEIHGHHRHRAASSSHSSYASTTNSSAQHREHEDHDGRDTRRNNSTTASTTTSSAKNATPVASDEKRKHAACSGQNRTDDAAHAAQRHASRRPAPAAGDSVVPYNQQPMPTRPPEERLPFFKLLYEIISAYGMVGYSMGGGRLRKVSYVLVPTRTGAQPNLVQPNEVDAEHTRNEDDDLHSGGGARIEAKTSKYTVRRVVIYQENAGSYSATWSVGSKMLLTIVMVLGKLRGMPESIDPSVATVGMN